MRTFITLLSTVLVLALGAGPAFAYDFPSTNDENRAQGLPHVNEVGSAPGEVTLQFTNADVNQLSFFEVRVDGQQVDRGPHPVVTGDTIHDGVCVDTRATGRVCSEGPVEMTFQATWLVEVRLALGGERDWDFDWTPFLVPQPQTTDDCRDGGWQAFGFRNQGQCIRYVQTGQDSRG